MAFQSHFGTGSVYPALDGVPFVLNERCRPPPKVTMPIKFEAGNPSDILFYDYDTSLEMSVVSRCRMEREALQIARLRRDQEASRIASVPAVESEPQDLHTQRNKEHSDKVTPGQRTDAVFQMINGGSMLVPTPISSASVMSHVNMTGIASAHNFVDLKDFESEQDPFENLSLRVMNDREELNKVFKVTADQQPSQASAIEQSTVDDTAQTASSVDSSTALLQYVNGIKSDGESASAISFVPCQTSKTEFGVPTSVASSAGCYQGVNSAIPFAGHFASPTCGNYLPPSSVNFANGSVLYANTQSSHPPIFAVSNTLLRSAKSSPDITKIDEKCDVSLARRTPPPTKPAALLKTEVPSRPVPPIRPAITSNVSETYLSLSVEARYFVDTICGMGFNQTDVACAVRELGVDDKQVLDHLCLLNQLRDRGHISNDAASALFLFPNSLEKAETFLKLVKNFSELGFNRDHIKDVLIKSNLDEEKSLDLLVGMS